MRHAIAVAVLALLPAPAAAIAGPPGRWESRPAAPLPRQEAGLAEVGGKLHLVGGFEYGAADSARHDVFDPATDSWTPALPLPQPEHHLQAVGIGGKLYVVGGLQTLTFIQTGTLREYDPATGLWTERAPLPAGRERGAGAAVAHDGRLYFLGGLRDNTPTAMVDVYDPATDGWSALPDMPTPRDHLGVAVVGGVLYAVGGRQAAFETEVGATEALDLASGTWRTGLAPIPTRRGGFATAAVGDQIVTIGGESPEGVHEDVEAYDPAGDRWRTLAPMPLPRHGIQGAAYAGGVWIAGGGTDLNVAATGAIDVFYPPPLEQAGGAVAPAAAPPAAAPALPAAKPRATIRVLRARRGSRRVVLRVETAEATRLTLSHGRVPARRGRTLARARVPAGSRRVVLRLRRPLRSGRYRITGAGASLVFRVR